MLTFSSHNGRAEREMDDLTQNFDAMEIAKKAIARAEAAEREAEAERAGRVKAEREAEARRAEAEAERAERAKAEREAEAERAGRVKAEREAEDAERQVEAERAERERAKRAGKDKEQIKDGVREWKIIDNPTHCGKASWDENVILRFHCSGSNVRYQWIHNTTRDKEKKNWKDVKQGNNSTLKLILRRKEDFGWYRCIARRNDQSKKLTSNDVEIKCWDTLLSPGDVSTKYHNVFSENFLTGSKFAASYSDAFLPFFWNDNDDSELDLLSTDCLVHIDFDASDGDISKSLSEVFSQWLIRHDLDHSIEVDAQDVAAKDIGTVSFGVGGHSARADVTFRLKSNKAVCIGTKSNKAVCIGTGDVKTHRCAGDPVFQFLQYLYIVRRFLSASGPLAAVEGYFPCFGFTFEGNLLSIFAAIVVYDENEGNPFIHQMTKTKMAYTHLASVLCDVLNKVQVARVLGKWLEGLKRLVAVYEGNDLMIYPSVTSYKNGSMRSFEYEECYRGMTFKAKEKGSSEKEKPIVVKITALQYGEKAHAHLSELDPPLAPRLLCVDKHAGKTMIVMDEVSDASPLSELSDDYLEEHRAAVIEALEVAMKSLGSTDFVHGDLREPNIMYNENTQRITLIDFELAGKEREVFYPLEIRTGIGWSEAVEKKLCNMKATKIPVTITKEDDASNLQNIINELNKL